MSLGARLAFAALIVAGVTACGGEKPQQSAADTLTRREKDSIIGQSGLPGARGVTRALGVSDSANKRNAELDSAGR